ncbi:hypothetical protein L484_002217 [Morus notabilis]|uniref:Putative plant transposon protein domain-containing protein n=1 Tax=Morus notabilis TaxID=981085 RepID=W9QCT1_9ROSA|nr:hypothetical protein L484_002217 [Morus notabilis]
MSNFSTTAIDEQSPPCLMTGSPQPGFPYWKLQFPVYPEGLKPRTPTRITDENPSQPSKKRATSVDSDPTFHPVEEQMHADDNGDNDNKWATKRPKKKPVVAGGSHRLTRASTMGPHPVIKDPSSDMFHKVLAHGIKFDFSPKVINDFLESHMEPANPDVDFDKNENSFPAVDFSLKYSTLHKIAMENWLPSFQSTRVHKQLAKVLYFIRIWVPFDVGLLIFEEIVSHAEVTSSKPAIPFPSLVYGILMPHHNIKTYEDVLEPPTEPLRVSQKLREGKHVNDVQGENDCTIAEVEGDSVFGDVTGNVASGSGHTSADAQYHRSILFLQKELAGLTKQEKALSQEQKEMKRETVAFLADVLATPSIPETAPVSAPE